MAKVAIQRVPKEAWAGLVSSLMEAYNMAIYSFTAPFLAQELFQQQEAWSALFFSYALIFAGSCLLYPAGALFYGFLGDKLGRQKTCTYATLGLALSTGMMGLIPFGEYAWVCFLLLIGAQHFFSGGEYNGSIVFSLEHAEEQRGGLMSATSCLFAVAGLMAANGFAALAHNTLWIRGCFLLGALGGIVSYFIKNHCKETPAFAALPTAYSSLQADWRNIVGAIVVLAFFMVSYSFLFLFLPLVRGAGTFDTLWVLGLYALSLVLGGVLADRVGARKVMAIGCALFALAIIPLSYFPNSIQAVLTLFASLVIGPIHSWLLRQFAVQERCRGIFISSAVATALFGGSTVLICLMLFEKSQSLLVCCLYPLLIAFCALTYLVRRT